MAVVADLSGNFSASLLHGVDQNLAKPNRNVTGSPINSVVPQFPGELVQDTTNAVIYRATGLTNSSWTAVVLVA